MTLNLIYEGFNYTSEYNGVFGDDDTLPSICSTGANTIAATVEFGINALDDTVYDSPTGTDAAEGKAISEAVGEGLTVMVRPLLDFLDNGPNGKYSPYEWREYFNPGAAGTSTCNAFFASYEKMILGQAALAVANGAQLLCIGTELDQICGPAYKAYWTNIISAIRSEYPTLKLTYSATWNSDTSPWASAGTGLSPGTGNLATQISFASELDYLGIDEYAPISNANNPTLSQLIAGWTQAPVDQGATAQTYAVTGGQSLISYYESVAAAVGKPIIFTEIGYSNSSSAASNPNAATGQDDQLQANLYQAFFQAWSESGNSSLAGALVWNWNPAPQNNTFGTISDVVNNTPALSVITDYFDFSAKAETSSVVGAGSVTGTAGAAGTGALAGDIGAGLSVLSVNGGTLGTAFKTTYGSLTLNADGSYTYFANAALLAAATGGGQLTDVITYTVGSEYGQTQTTTLTFDDDRDPTAVKEAGSVAEGCTLTATAGSGGTGALAGDSNPVGTSLTVTALTQSGQATTQPIAGKYGTLVLNSNGSYTYTPNVTEETAGFKADGGAALDDTFSLQVTGSSGASSSSTLTIKITEAKAAPLDFEGDGRSDILFVDGQDDGLCTWAVDDKTIVGGGFLGSPGPCWTYEGTGDFYGDGHSDVLWRNQDGSLWLWRMNGSSIVSAGEIANPFGTWTVVGIGDFNGNGRSDILFRDQAGDLATWDMNGFQIVSCGGIGNPGAGWTFLGTGDVNGNGISDLLFENTSGMIGMWTLDDRTVTGGAILGACPAGWVYEGVGDFGPNGGSSILFAKPETQQVAFWNISNDAISSCAVTVGLQGPGWTIVGVGDYTAGAGSSILFYNSLLNQYATRNVVNDVFVSGGTVGYPGAQYSVSSGLPATAPELPPMAFFQSASGAVEAFNVANGVVSGTFQYGTLPSVLGVGDFVGDGQADILFRQSNGAYAFDETSGSAIVQTGVIGNPGGTWTFKGIGDFDLGGCSDLLFEDANGNYEVLDPQGQWSTATVEIGNPGASWTFAGVGDFNGDGSTDILLQQQQGSATTYGIWEIGENKPIGGGTIGSPGSGWTLLGVGDFNGDGKSDLLFENANGMYGTWDLNGTTIVGGSMSIGTPGANLHFAGIADLFGNHDGSILFQNTSTGQYSTWNMNDTAIVNTSQIGSPGPGWVEKAFV